MSFLSLQQPLFRSPSKPLALFSTCVHPRFESRILVSQCRPLNNHSYWLPVELALLGIIEAIGVTSAVLLLSLTLRVGIHLLFCEEIDAGKVFPETP